MTLCAREGRPANENILNVFIFVFLVPDIGWSMRSALHLSLD